MTNFTSLPREVRDKIYHHMLVHESLTILSTPAFLKSSADFTVNRRTTRNMETGQRTILQQSYRLAKKPSEDPPNLAIFLINHQCYIEAREVFYTRNSFDFSQTTKTFDSVQNCSGFLQDRPKHSLKLIREIHLQLSEQLACPIWEQIRPFDIDFDLICYRLNKFGGLKVLGLRIEGTRVNNTISEMYRRLGGEYDVRIQMAEWTKQLCKINGLKGLALGLKGYHSMEEAMYFVQLLRARMVFGGDGIELTIL